MAKDYSEQENSKKSLNKIMELGINPYPANEYILTTNAKKLNKITQKRE